MQIDFKDQTKHITTETKNILEKLIHYTSNQENIPDSAELSVRFVDNETIKSLNNTYRGLNEVTDVLSFGIHDDNIEKIVQSTNIPVLLGDIVISVEKAQEQATEYNHPLIREYGFLTVHGLLHLLGYNHENKADEQVMFKKQNMILDALEIER